MTDDPFSVNPLFDTWLKAQNQFFEAQQPFWKQMKTQFSADDNKELFAKTNSFWEEAQKNGREWVDTYAAHFPSSASAEGVARETLERMMDPTQFLYAGSDQINQTIQKLVEGPEFADIGTLERQGLKSTAEWIALREASAEYRFITAKAWGRAFERFSESTLGKSDVWKKSPNAVIHEWLEVANDELIVTQRTKEFLDAQRKLLRAGVEYRIRERAMVETWCETHSIPTRTEVDDLHRAVYQLKREVRDLKKRAARSAGSLVRAGDRAKADFPGDDNDRG